MNDIHFIPAAHADRVFFETQLVEEGQGEARRDGRRVGSRLTFGEPAIYDLVDLMKAQGSEPGFEITSQLDRYEFLLLRLVTTLHVASNAAVSWFEVHVELGGSGVAGHDPIVHDLYPLLVEDKVELERTAKISPSLKFMDVAVSLGEGSVATKYVRLDPKITAYGKRESKAYWSFTPGSGSEVAGGIKEMDLIVRRFRAIPAHATIFAKGIGRQWGIFENDVNLEHQRFDI